MYKEKDSDFAVRFWTVDGNTTHSVELSALGKYVLYQIQILAFTRIGDGRPSTPAILERTLDDGKHVSTKVITVYSVVLIRFDFIIYVITTRGHQKHIEVLSSSCN